MRRLFIALLGISCGLPDAGTTTSGDDLVKAASTVRASSSADQIQVERHYPLQATDAVYFFADISASSGTHDVSVEIHDPSGNVYQRTTQMITVTADPARATATLPVLGTWISQYNMAGDWSCHVFLDDSTEVAAVTFILF